jgi:hypothetical protein
MFQHLAAAAVAAVLPAAAAEREQRRKQSATGGPREGLRPKIRESHLVPLLQSALKNTEIYTER